MNKKIVKTAAHLKEIVLPLFAAVLVYIIVSAGGCDDTVTSSEIDRRIIPDQNVSYQSHIQPIFDVKCTSSGCHDNNSRAGGLSLTTWANTTLDPGVVFPGDPDNSRLVWSVEGNSANPMPPPGYPVLTKNQIQGVRTWIDEGALNN